ncbi:unnamed protein product [Effrenium voratum]|nr:unnamed protein product [Effrenium voratum]
MKVDREVMVSCGLMFICRSLVLHGFAGDSTGGKPNQEPPPSAESSTSAATASAASAASSASSAATGSTALRSVGAQVLRTPRLASTGHVDAPTPDGRAHAGSGVRLR